MKKINKVMCHLTKWIMCWKHEMKNIATKISTDMAYQFLKFIYYFLIFISLFSIISEFSSLYIVMHFLHFI